MAEVYEKKFNIVTGNEERFEKVANNLKRKSEELGLNFRYSIDYGSVFTDTDGNQKITARIVYELPSMGEYKLIATLEIYEGKNLVEVLDKRYSKYLSGNIRDFTGYCHHCQQNRKRRYLYLLWDNRNKRVLQLGKSCSKNYIGKGNVDRLYKYAEEVGKVSEGMFRRKTKYYYINTEEYLKVAMSKLLYFYQSEKYVTERNALEEGILFSYIAKVKGRTSDSKLEVINGEEVRGLVNEAKEYINERSDKVTDKGYNVHTLISKNNIRSDKISYVLHYLMDFIDSKVRGYNSEDTFKIVPIVNLAFNYLTEDVDFIHSGENSSYANILRMYGGDRVSIQEDVRELRDEWLEYVKENRHKEFESIVANMIDNNEVEISPKGVKVVVNNIGFYIKNRGKIEVEGKFVGNKGERINVDARIVSVATFHREAYTGGLEQVYVYTFKNDEAEFVWFTTKGADSLEEQTNKTMDELRTKGAKISGKVKDHKKYNDRKQTVLNYVKLI